MKDYKNTRISAWLFLIIAIALEVFGLALLQAIPLWLKPYSTNDSIVLFGHSISISIFSKIILLMIIAISYYCMSLALRSIALGVAYATWEILGLIGVIVVSLIFFNPALTLQQSLGIVLGFIGIICVILGEDH